MIVDAQISAANSRTQHRSQKHSSPVVVAAELPQTSATSKNPPESTPPQSLEEQLESIRILLSIEQVHTETELIAQCVEALNVDLLPHSGPPILVGTRLIVLQPGE